MPQIIDLSDKNFQSLRSDGPVSDFLRPDRTGPFLAKTIRSGPKNSPHFLFWTGPFENSPVRKIADRTGPFLAKTVRSGPKNGPHFCAPDRTGLDRGQPSVNRNSTGTFTFMLELYSSAPLGATRSRAPCESGDRRAL